MTLPITVIVPVGPHPHNRTYLDQCIASVFSQRRPPAELLIIANGGPDRHPDSFPMWTYGLELNWRYFAEPLGIAGAFNKGVELARNEWVFFLGSDDALMPDCLERCWQAWQRFGDVLGWYGVAVQYDNGFSQNTPCMAAMINKALWSLHNGFETTPEKMSGPDTYMIWKMLEGKGGATYRVAEELLYYVRIPPSKRGDVGIDTGQVEANPWAHT